MLVHETPDSALDFVPLGTGAATIDAPPGVNISRSRWPLFFMNTVPTLCEAFAPLRASLGRAGEPLAARQVYAGLAPVDFSKFVLQAAPDRLAVVPVRGVGWNDLGDPTRLQMTQNVVRHAVAG